MARPDNGFIPDKLLPWLKAKNKDYKAKKLPATIDQLIKDIEKRL